MKKQYTLLLLLVLCIGGVGVIGAELYEQTQSDCPNVTEEEIAMGRSRLGFPGRDLKPRDEAPSCLESEFSGTIAFHDRDLSPEDVVEMAAAAGWTTDAEDLLDTTCFQQATVGWERMQLVMSNDGKPISRLSFSFNPDGACRPNPS